MCLGTLSITVRCNPLLAAGTTLLTLTKDESLKSRCEITTKASDCKATDLAPANKAVCRLENDRKHPTRGNND